MLRAGGRLACPQCPTEVVVVRAANGDPSITCQGVGLVDITEPRALAGHAGDRADQPAGDGPLLGKRYVDEQTDLELLCTKAGPGTLACDGRPLGIRAPKPLPSSD
ncbi:MAG: hypothetical protein M3R71_01595 [Actinomycetota bacterium]|nr:hypothetical protein [Actinomycetota bacterium]